MNDFYCDMNCKSCIDGCSRRLVPPDITESDLNIQSMKILGERFVRQIHEDDEWHETEPGHYQNNRYSAVFKDKDGIAYDIHGKVFTDDGENWYSNNESRVNITFPYTVPDKPEYVYLNKKEED